MKDRREGKSEAQRSRKSREDGKASQDCVFVSSMCSNAMLLTWHQRERLQGWVEKNEAHLKSETDRVHTTMEVTHRHTQHWKKGSCAGCPAFQNLLFSGNINK